jgi:hypothetical protein
MGHQRSLRGRWPLTAAALLLVAAMALLSGCQSLPTQSSDQPLGAAEVRALFSGMTVEAYNRKTRVTSFTVYHPDGRLTQERLWTRREGKWSIQPDGRICLGFGGREGSCRHIVKRGDTYYKLVPDDAGKPQRLIRYRYFEAGDALAKR